jgi:hypothetical protein
VVETDLRGKLGFVFHFLESEFNVGLFFIQPFCLFFTQSFFFRKTFLLGDTLALGLLCGKFFRKLFGFDPLFFGQAYDS